MKRIYLLAILVGILAVGCAGFPKITLAPDRCLRYENSWDAEKAIPPVTLCVCSEDVFTSVEAAISTFVSRPDKIEIQALGEKNVCRVPVSEVPGNEDVKELLSK